MTGFIQLYLKDKDKPIENSVETKEFPTRLDHITQIIIQKYTKPLESYSTAIIYSQYVVEGLQSRLGILHSIVLQAAVERTPTLILCELHGVINVPLKL